MSATDADKRDTKVLAPLLLYTMFSFMITVRPLAVVTCFAFPLESRTLFEASFLFVETVVFGIRST